MLTRLRKLWLPGPRASLARTLVLAMTALLATTAQAQSNDPTVHGQVRLQWEEGQTDQAATLQTELRASTRGVTAVATLQQQHGDLAGDAGRAWFNELYATHDAGAWQFSAGKKIVSWDVGYGFRPNDMVQQEQRRSLISSTLEGRPLLMAEYFSLDAAWSWVWVNPTADSETSGAGEPALALRYYRRDGALDWHGFARVGAHSAASLGAAVAWVAGDALELHSSLRLQSAQSQFLLGGTWTHSSQLSLLAEGWWDGAATPPLRNNIYLRLSWQHEGWQPAMDLLYLPADESRVTTASVAWQGDRWQLQAGLRSFVGPASAAIMQSPRHQLAYAAATWTF